MFFFFIPGLSAHDLSRLLANLLYTLGFCPHSALFVFSLCCVQIKLKISEVMKADNFFTFEGHFNQYFCHLEAKI